MFSSFQYLRQSFLFFSAHSFVDEIYPIVETGSFLNGKIPKSLMQAYNLADENYFTDNLK